MKQAEEKAKRPSAKELLDLARSHGLDNKKIRNITGAGRTTLWRWENDEADMPPRRRAKLIAAFAV